MAAYGTSQYGSHARTITDVAAPAGSVAGTATRARTGSLALTTRQNIGGTGTRARTGSATLNLTAYTVTWNIELSQSGYRSRDAHLSLSVDVAVVPPPASAAETYIKKVVEIMPDPTLNQFGRPT